MVQATLDQEIRALIHTDQETLGLIHMVQATPAQTPMAALPTAPVVVLSVETAETLMTTHMEARRRPEDTETLQQPVMIHTDQAKPLQTTMDLATLVHQITTALQTPPLTTMARPTPILVMTHTETTATRRATALLAS
jgi:hypothetical protein